MLTESDFPGLLQRAEDALRSYLGKGVIESVTRSKSDDGHPYLICNVKNVVSEVYTITPVDSQRYVVAGALHLQNKEITGDLDLQDEDDPLYMMAKDLADANEIGIGKDQYSDKLIFLKTVSPENLYEGISKIRESEEDVLACLAVASQL